MSGEMIVFLSIFGGLCLFSLGRILGQAEGRLEEKERKESAIQEEGDA